MSMMDSLAQADVQAFEAIEKELNRQRTKLELIASENIVSRAVMEAQGSVLTNKYAEGYPGKRYYGGCEYVDIVEQLAIDRAKELFGAATSAGAPVTARDIPLLTNPQSKFSSMLRRTASRSPSTAYASSLFLNTISAVVSCK